MNKKLVIGPAALLVIAAFAAMPASSQGACTAPACPHVYINGVMGQEGKELRAIFWMTLRQTSTAFVEANCHHIFAGFTENPTGGGAAKGKIQGYFAYECEDPGCTAAGGER